MEVKQTHLQMSATQVSNSAQFIKAKRSSVKIESVIATDGGSSKVDGAFLQCDACGTVNVTDSVIQNLDA